MNKYLFFYFLCFSFFSFAQKREKLGAFANFDTNIGIDIPALAERNRAENDYEITQLELGYFNYGFSGSIGYQPLDRFAISGGIRYSYINPNFHMLYWQAQPYFFLGDLENQDYGYIFLKGGTKINETAAKKAGFVGLGLGKVETLGKNFGHQFQIFVETQSLDSETALFLGFSYGIIIFSNKNQ